METPLSLLSWGLAGSAEAHWLAVARSGTTDAGDCRGEVRPRLRMELEVGIENRDSKYH